MQGPESGPKWSPLQFSSNLIKIHFLIPTVGVSTSDLMWHYWKSPWTKMIKGINTYKGWIGHWHHRINVFLLSFSNYLLELQKQHQKSPFHLSAESGSPSHVKSGAATSWMGISFRKAGFWQRGFPLTTRVLFSHWPNQAKWQSHTYGLDRRLLQTDRGRWRYIQLYTARNVVKRKET